ncbi:MAG TPA: response regulator [Thermotogota bacterium]|nr:response regulator [Thermotogota bacterium]HRW92757.1 response regulator [Thermotogota bacterium]
MPAKPWNMLIVEDNPVDLFILKNLLRNGEESSREFHHVASLQDAFEVLKTQTIDIILLDLYLLDSWGLETLVRLRQQCPLVPVVVITGHEESDWALESLKHGAQDYLIKNQLNRTILHRVIRYAVERQGFYLNLEKKAQELEVLTGQYQKAAQNFEAMALELLKRLSQVAQTRDHVTGQHTERVGQMARLVAEAIGMSQEESLQIRLTAPMHDIGKVGISDKILLKPGPLDPEEWKAMQQHTTIGFNLLKDSIHPILKKAALIALSHHEKWDGSGYPQGLRANEIPLEAQVVGIVDVFDALTSKRPYKEAWSYSRAMEFLQNQKNISFHPELVQQVLELEADLIHVKESFSFQ